MPRLADDRGAEGADPERLRHCPICGKPQAHVFRPFCSKRCADVDLGRWLGDRYAIPGESVEPDDERGPPADGDPR